MSETRCKRCNRRISDSTAQYGEKCAKLLGYRDSKNDVSGRVADVQHVAHEVIAGLENLGIDWKRDVGQEMFYDMVQEEYLRILSGESNLQELSQFSRRPPKDALSLYKELMREELRRQEKATLPGERMPERYQNGMEYSKEQILGAIPKAKQKAALLVERMPEWYQYNMEYSKEKIGYEDKLFQTMGCGPLAMAMIIKALIGLTVSPLELAKYGVVNKYYYGNGTSSDFFAPVAAEYGLNISEISYDKDGSEKDMAAAKDALIAALRSGNPVIAYMGPGAFTGGGHYMVLGGVSDDGSKILVFDGGKEERYNRYYDTDLILEQAKSVKGNFRVLTYDGKYQDDGMTFKKK